MKTKQRLTFVEEENGETYHVSMLSLPGLEQRAMITVYDS